MLLVLIATVPCHDEQAKSSKFRVDTFKFFFEKWTILKFLHDN